MLYTMQDMVSTPDGYDDDDDRELQDPRNKVALAFHSDVCVS